MATITLYSTNSIPISRLDGNSMGQNPIRAAVNGNAFSWQNPSDVQMTFGQPNASVTFADQNSVLSGNPVSGSNVTDQLLQGSTTIDGTAYSQSDSNVLWQGAVYVRAEYTVTLYDAAGQSYEMAGVSIVSGYSPAVAGVAFVNGAPPPGTTLYYRQGNSGFDGDPELPLDAICFAAGSLIATEGGEVAVEDLRPGMRVVTRDGGLQPVLWVGQRRLDAAALSAAPHLHPIRIRAGALGPDLPRRDLVVSPQHRILVRSTIAQRMFGAAEVLVAAKALLDLDGVEIAGDLQAVTYVHFLLPRHHVVLAEGLESKSLLTGPQALRTLGKAARAEIEALLPGVLDGDHQPRGARPLPPVGRARRLAQRHSRNGRPLVQ